MAKKMRSIDFGKKKLWILIGIFFVLFLISTQLITFATDIVWFRQIGYLSTYLRGVFASLMIGVPTFFGVSLLVYLFFNKTYKDFLVHFNTLEEENQRKPVKRGIALVTFVLSFGFTRAVVSEGWMNMLKAIHGVSFGINDPIFQKDLGLLHIYSQSHTEATYEEIVKAFCEEYDKIPKSEMNRVLGNLGKQVQ